MASTSISIYVSGITLVILILIVSVCLILLRLNRQELKQKVKEQEVALQFQEELRMVENEVSESLMQHISRELHDDVQHSLTHVRMQLELMMHKKPENLPQIQQLEEQVFETIEGLRMLSKRLSTDFISDQTFTDMVVMEAERLELSGKFKVSVTGTEGTDALSPENRIIAYRIFQEMVVNIIKHSEASEIHIKLSPNPWSLQVTDNGKGFDLQHVMSGNRKNGLHNMKKRALLADLRLEIATEPEKGCTYRLLTQAANQN